MILDSVKELKANKLVETPEGGEEHQLRSTEYGDVMSKVRDGILVLCYRCSYPRSFM